MRAGLTHDAITMAARNVLIRPTVRYFIPTVSQLNWGRPGLPGQAQRCFEVRGLEWVSSTLLLGLKGSD